MDQYNGEAGDMLIPLRSAGKLAQYKAVPMQDALGDLREAARPLANTDDTMGP